MKSKLEAAKKTLCELEEKHEHQKNERVEINEQVLIISQGISSPLGRSSGNKKAENLRYSV